MLPLTACATYSDVVKTALGVLFFNVVLDVVLLVHRYADHSVEIDVLLLS